MNPLTSLSSIQPPDGEAIKAKAQQTLASVANYRIASDEEYTLAGEELVAIKTKAKRLEEQRTSITGPLNAAVKAVNDLFREPADYLNRAEATVKAAMISYTQAKEAAAAAARAEAERMARAAREAAEAAARQAAELARQGNAEEAAKLEAQAIEAELSAAASAPVVPIAPKAAGVSKVSVKHKARVTHIRLFLAHALLDGNDHLLGLVGISESGLNKLASAMGPAMKVPGVELYEERSISARAA